MSEAPELIRLRQQVRESRHNLGREYEGLLGEIDVPRKIAGSVRSHPLAWIGGAAAAGLALTLFGRGGSRKGTVPARTPAAASSVSSDALRGGSPVTRAGIVAGLIQAGRLLYPVLRPVLLEYASKAASIGIERIRRTRS